MALPTEFQFVLVTPEKTLLNEPVISLRFPLFDGQIGILPGRAPLVGRLGYGELTVTDGNGDRSFFIDGGFVQVKGAVVSILTDRSIPADEINLSESEEGLTASLNLSATTDSELADRDVQQQRSRRLIALAKKPR